MSGLKLCEYFYPQPDSTWSAAKLSGINYATMRLPEDDQFELDNIEHWQTIADRFHSYGLKPLVVEPLPNKLHDVIKLGGENVNKYLEQVTQMLRAMDKMNIRCLCFNFMAGVGWTRTDTLIQERGGALVTGFDVARFEQPTPIRSEEQIWENYWRFIRTVLPAAEKYGVRLALHPDDPPLAKLGDMSRIMGSYKNIRKAIETIPSDYLGLTFCQACYFLMGEDLFKIVPEIKDKIFFIHFRNVNGTPMKFRETFHDNGELPMGKLMQLYYDLGLEVPIRADHVPLYPDEQQGTAGYTAMGKHFAIGYIKGLMECAEIAARKNISC